MRTMVAATVVFSSLVSAAQAQQEEWLPPQVEEGTAQQLAGRLQQAGFQPEGVSLAEGARRAVVGIRQRLESWGVEGVLERAPSISTLSLPTAGQRYLDAMAHYNVCNLVFFRQHLQPTDPEDADARVMAALGLTAVTLAVIYLRLPFLAAGGSVADIEAFLTGDAMTPVFERLQADPELLAQVEGVCRPLVAALLEPPG